MRAQGSRAEGPRSGAEQFGQRVGGAHALRIAAGTVLDVLPHRGRRFHGPCRSAERAAAAAGGPQKRGRAVRHALPCRGARAGCSLLRLPRPERRRGPAPRPRRRGANPCRRGGRAAGVRGCGLLPLRQPREGRRGSAAQGAAPYRGRARRAVLVRVGARPPGGARAVLGDARHAAADARLLAARRLRPRRADAREGGRVGRPLGEKAADRCRRAGRRAGRRRLFRPGARRLGDGRGGGRGRRPCARRVDAHRGGRLLPCRDARFRGHGHSHEGNGLPLSHRGCQRLRRRVVFCLRLAFYALQLAGAA